VNNLLYQHKMPLFVSLDDTEGGMTGGGGGGGGGDRCGTDHFIPEKFSDLFRDLAVPAGLFMMPALFRPRHYARSVVTEEVADSSRSGNDGSDDDSDSDDSDSTRRKPVPDDIFDTLLSLVTPSERIQHDVKTRRYKGGRGGSKKSQNKTRRGKME
jgi:hypothetical protein